MEPRTDSKFRFSIREVGFLTAGRRCIPLEVGGLVTSGVVGSGVEETLNISYTLACRLLSSIVDG